jgi:hypothetical protein
MIVNLKSIVSRDPAISELADLPPGWQATRIRDGGPWKRSELSEFERGE